MPVELDPATYGLTIWDLDREFLTDGVGGTHKLTLGDLLGVLRDAYCRTIGVEYMHIQNTEEQAWIQDHVETKPTAFSKTQKDRILERVNSAEAFEKFLATKYVGTKRFGIEGAESAIPILDEILSCAADENLVGAVIGMAHRGRLNVLSNIIGKSYEAIFSEFEGHVDPNTVQGSGDVKYHLGATGKYVSPTGADIPVELAANPSHLETVDPIVMGMVRARQDQIEPIGAFSVLPLLIHGDAAFAGQGIVAECLAMSDIAGYRVGGTIHLIINNQIGFTTAPEMSRSSLYCSDVAKTVQAPIFHVNGDDPEACVRVARLAWEYRQEFHKDVVIDMVCYRRHGHNEGDDPSYTQPLMYQAISERRSVRKLYVETLVKRGDITVDEAEQALSDFQSKLQVALEETRSKASEVHKVPPPPKPVGVLPHIPTGVERSTLERIYAQLTAYPEGFTPHPKLAKQFELRNQQFEAEHDLDWATAEALAVGSLMLEGHPVRLAGEDTRRGTFSQRHAALVDYRTGMPWIPLSDLEGAEANFWVYDSLLSEYAALGYEYGYAHANPEALVIWEAQFGDFINGAQIIVDQYIVAAEDKWGQRNGVVLLLPHGYEGQGPEHSSARIERFLTLSAEDNMQICNATTAAQYFHLLRRQVHSERHTPLVLFTPKQGLRMKQTAFTPGRVDDRVLPGGARRPVRRGSVRGATSGVLLGQGRLGCHGSPRRTARAGRDRAGRAALSAADHRDAPHRAGALPQRQGTAVAAGRAREHGRLELHRAQRLADQGSRLRPAPHRPLRVGEPGDRIEGRARPGTRQPDGQDLQGSLARALEERTTLGVVVESDDRPVLGVAGAPQALDPMVAILDDESAVLERHDQRRRLPALVDTLRHAVDRLEVVVVEAIERRLVGRPGESVEPSERELDRTVPDRLPFVQCPTQHGVVTAVAGEEAFDPLAEFVAVAGRPCPVDRIVQVRFHA